MERSPYIIDSLTVLHGPSAVVYGSGSLGGGIIMNTISPEKSKDNKSVFIQQYETASSSVLSHFHSIYKVKRSSFLSSISLKQYGKTKMGKNRFHQYHSWLFLQKTIIESLKIKWEQITIKIFADIADVLNAFQSR